MNSAPQKILSGKPGCNAVDCRKSGQACRKVIEQVCDAYFEKSGKYTFSQGIMDAAEGLRGISKNGKSETVEQTAKRIEEAIDTKQLDDAKRDKKGTLATGVAGALFLAAVPLLEHFGEALPALGTALAAVYNFMLVKYAHGIFEDKKSQVVDAALSKFCGYKQGGSLE